MTNKNVSSRLSKIILISLVVIVPVITYRYITKSIANQKISEANQKLSEGEIWRIDEYVGPHGIVVTENGVLFTALTGMDKKGFGDCYCIFYANKTTGEVLWNTEKLAESFIEYDPDKVDVWVTLELVDENQDIVFVSIGHHSNHTLFTLNLDSGEILWKYENIFRKSILDAHGKPVKGENVYILSEDGKLLSVNKVSGKINWERKLFDAPPEYRIDYRNGIFIYDEIIFIRDASDPQPNPKIHAFNMHTGEKLWDVDVRKTNGFQTAYEDGIFVDFGQEGDWDGMRYMEGIETRSGQRLWEESFFVVTADHPIPYIVNGRVYILIGDSRNKSYREFTLHVFDSKTGEPLWKFYQKPTGDPLIFTVKENVVFIGANTFGGVVKAIDASTGETIWEKKTPSMPTCLQLEDKLLFVGSDEVFLAAFQIKSGELLWQIATPTRFINDNCFNDNRHAYINEDLILIYNQYKKAIIFLDKETGNQKWAWSDPRNSVSRFGYSPQEIIFDIKNIIISNHQRLYAINVENDK